jgi:hypothetical protein
MRSHRRLAAALLVSALTFWALIFPALASAQAGYIAIEQRLSAGQLREVGLTPEQLATLNRMLREADAAVATATVPTAAAVPVTTATPATTAGPMTTGEAATVAASAGVDPTPDDRSSWIGFNDEPIVSRVHGTVASWEPGTVFVLENGQQWKVLKGYATLSKPRESPQIRVVPGVAGRWFLEVDPDMPKARVYRID